jgi:hypothetical protein
LAKLKKELKPKKIDNTLKAIVNDKEDKKLKQTAGPKGKPKAVIKEDKPKILHIHEFIDKDAVLIKPTTSNPKSQTRATNNERNFPILGDQPKQKQYSQQGGRSQNQNQGQGQGQQNQGQGQGGRPQSGQNQNPQGNRQNQGQGQGQQNQGQGQQRQQVSGQNQNPQGSRPNQGQGQGQQNKPQDK